MWSIVRALGITGEKTIMVVTAIQAITAIHPRGTTHTMSAKIYTGGSTMG